MGFVSDHLSHGRRFRVLDIVDDFTKEMVVQLVNVSITGRQVARFLNQIGDQRPLPDSILRQWNGVHQQSDVLLEQETITRSV